MSNHEALKEAFLLFLQLVADCPNCGNCKQAAVDAKTAIDIMIDVIDAK